MKLYIHPHGDAPYADTPGHKERTNLDTLFAQLAGRTAAFTLTDDPDDADAITCCLRFVERFSAARDHAEGVQACLRAIADLPLVNDPRYQGRHFFVSSHCLFPVAELAPCAVFKGSVSALDHGANEFAIPLFSEDYADIAAREPNCDFGFAGAVTHPVRAGILRAAPRYGASRILITDKYFWDLPAEEREWRRREFVEICGAARFILCPRGFGESSFRLFEALSMGRVPVVVSDTVALPFADVVDWDRIAVRLGEGEDQWDRLRDLAAMPHDQWRDMAARGRETWTRYLSKEAMAGQILRQFAAWTPGECREIAPAAPPPAVTVPAATGGPTAVPEPEACRRAWTLLGRRHPADRPLLVFGAGKFLRRFLGHVADRADGPALAGIADDGAAGQTLLGHTLRPLAGFRSETDFAAVFLATDSAEDKLAERCRAVFGAAVPLVRWSGLLQGLNIRLGSGGRDHAAREAQARAAAPDRGGAELWRRAYAMWQAGDECADFRDCVLVAACRAAAPRRSERLYEYAFVEKHLGWGGSGRLLDVGSRTSDLPRQLAACGYEVTCLDPGARNRIHDGVREIHGDIRASHLAPRCFDAITCISTLEHVGVPGRYGIVERDDAGDGAALAEMFRLLRPGGRLVLTVPCGKAPLLPINRVYTQARVRELAAGFEVVDAEFFHPDGKGGWTRCTAAAADAWDWQAQGYYALGCWLLERPAEVVAPPATPAPRRILYGHCYSWGDVLCGTMFVRELRRRYPRAEIVWAVNRNIAPMLDTNPDVSRLLPLDAGEYKGDASRGLKETWPLVRAEAASGAYDLVVLPQICPDHLDDMPRQKVDEVPVRDFIGMMEHYAGLTLHERRLVLPLTAADRAAAAALRTNARYHVTLTASGCSVPDVWPNARYAELVRRLRDHLDGDVYLLGDRTAAAVDGCIDLRGKTNARESAAFIDQADLHIGLDTFTMWLALTTDTPTVTLRCWDRYPRLTAYDNIRMGGNVLDLDNPTVDEVLDAVLDRLPGPLFPRRREQPYWSLQTGYQCTLKCPYCIQHFGLGDGGLPRFAPLPVTDFLRLNDLPVTSDELYIQGGEPLLYPEIEDLLCCLTAFKRLIVVTNGSIPITRLNLDRLRCQPHEIRFYFSFHPSQVDPEAFEANVERARDLGLLERVSLVKTSAAVAARWRDHWQARDVELTVYEEQGFRADGSFHPAAWADGCNGRPHDPVRCSSRLVLISPDGYFYNCHAQMYRNDRAAARGSLWDPPNLTTHGYVCADYGRCQPCQTGHVRIRPLAAEPVGADPVSPQRLLDHWQSLWRELAAGDRRVALFGAGGHSRWLVPWLRHWGLLTTLDCILDDRAEPGQTLHGIPVRRPAAVPPLPDVVVVSTDTCAAALAARCAKLPATVIDPYAAFPPGPYEKWPAPKAKAVPV